MDVTVGSFTHTEGGPVCSRLTDGLHFHVESSLLGTGDVESGVTVCLVTLDASPRAALLANIAGQLPPRGGDVLDAVYGLQEDRVGKAHLWDPEGTDSSCATEERFGRNLAVAPLLEPMQLTMRLAVI